MEPGGKEIWLELVRLSGEEVDSLTEHERAQHDFAEQTIAGLVRVVGDTAFLKIAERVLVNWYASCQAMATDYDEVN